MARNGSGQVPWLGLQRQAWVFFCLWIIIRLSFIHADEQINKPQPWVSQCPLKPSQPGQGFDCHWWGLDLIFQAHLYANESWPDLTWTYTILPLIEGAMDSDEVNLYFWTETEPCPEVFL